MERYEEVKSRRNATENATAAAIDTKEDDMEGVKTAAVEQTAFPNAQGDMGASEGSTSSENGVIDAIIDGEDSEEEKDDVDGLENVMAAGVDASDAVEDNEEFDADDDKISFEIAHEIAVRLIKLLNDSQMPTGEENRITVRRVMQKTLKRILARLTNYVDQADPPRKTGLVKTTRAAIKQNGDDDEFKEYTVFDELRTSIGETIVEFLWYELSFSQDSQRGFSRHYVDDDTEEELLAIEAGLEAVIIEMTRQIKEIQEQSKQAVQDSEETKDGQTGSQEAFEGENPNIMKMTSGKKSSYVKWEAKEELMAWELFWDAEGKYSNRHIAKAERASALNSWSSENTENRSIRTWAGMEQHMNNLIKNEKQTLHDLRDAVGEADADEIHETAKSIIASLELAAGTKSKKAGGNRKGRKAKSMGVGESAMMSGGLGDVAQTTQSSGQYPDEIDFIADSAKRNSAKRKRTLTTQAKSADKDGAEVDREVEDDVPEPASKRIKGGKVGKHGKRRDETASEDI